MSASTWESPTAQQKSSLSRFALMWIFTTFFVPYPKYSAVEREIPNSSRIRNRRISIYCMDGSAAVFLFVPEGFLPCPGIGVVFTISDITPIEGYTAFLMGSDPYYFIKENELCQSTKESSKP